MKIKKTLFSTEIEFQISELEEIRYRVPVTMLIGLLKWIKYKFGLDLGQPKKKL
jgi:hypothetical protein